MKIAKRILAAALAFALALSFALPGMAAVNWDEFKITKQPAEQNLKIKYGDSFTLSVEVNVPEGVEVAYQWLCESSRIEGATAPELHLGPDDPCYPESYWMGKVVVDYICEITAYEKDEDGNVITSRNKRSDRVSVMTEATFLGKLVDITIGPFGYALTACIIILPLGMIFPISYPIAVLAFYVYGFLQLFGLERVAFDWFSSL